MRTASCASLRRRKTSTRTSGSTYQSEIEAAIVAQGSYPLPHLQVEDGQGDSGNTIPATTRRLRASRTRRGITQETRAASSPRTTTRQTRLVRRGTSTAVNIDTDNSAVSGTYNGVEDGSSTLANGVVASPTAPVGYCITLSTDSSPGGQ